MGKYNVVFKCGREEEVQLFGKHKDREKRIEWYESVSLAPSSRQR